MMQKNPNDPNGIDTMRLLGAIVISLAILFAFNFLVEKPRAKALEKQLAAQKIAGIENPAIETLRAQVVEPLTREEIVQSSQIKRLLIEGERITGSLSVQGARIDDVLLKGYFETTAREKEFSILTPAGTEQPYYADFGWIAKQVGTVLPTSKTIWQVKGNTVLTSNDPVVLTWNNGQNLNFEREISLDENYMFTITQRVTNTGMAGVSLLPYQLISRHGMPKDYRGFFIQHEGPLGFLGKDLTEVDYDDLREDGEETKNSKGGWVGFTDRYWFTSLIPEKNTENKIRFIQSGEEGTTEKFQTDILGAEQLIPAGQTVAVTTQFFAGAKEYDVLKVYKAEGIENFDLTLDFGMWFFITKPLLTTLLFLSKYFGSVAIAILVLTVILRGVLFPLTNKSFISMAKMKKVAPRLKELQEKHKDDREKMQMAILELYQKEGVNPLSGCWPMLLQIPIFFALYKVILINVGMRHAPFWGWIDDMSEMDPTSVFTGFGLVSWELPAILLIGAWPCMMGLTMLLQRRFSPPPPDKTQAMLLNIMPVFLTFIMSKFAAGLVIYWTWSNFLAISQQYIIMRREGVEVSLVHGHGERRKNKETSK